MEWIKAGIEILPSRRSLAVVAGMKKLNDHAKPTKVDAKIKNKKNVYVVTEMYMNHFIQPINVHKMYLTQIFVMCQAKHVMYSLI